MVGAVYMTVADKRNIRNPHRECKRNELEESKIHDSKQF
jgi:hypothetical protein